MKKYRIVMHNGKFRIQEKFLFGWINVMSIGDCYIQKDTQKEAEDTIKKWQKYDSENGKVIKEF